MFTKTELTKRNVSLMLEMIETELVTYKHYSPWADRLIVEMDKPPYWLLNLATVQYKGDALRILKEFLYSEPFEDIAGGYEREHIACLFLRYERRELSWATFLREAGAFADAREGPVACEFFYDMLNKLEDSDFSSDVETTQVEEILKEFSGAIEVVRTAFNEIRPGSQSEQS